jgi:beta-glucanase (GH16 family)
MKTTLLFIYIVLFVILIRCSEKPTAQIVWSDEFNYSGQPDSTKWNYDLGGHGWGNNELQNYTRNNKNVRVENGVLIIEAHKDSLENNAFTSARLISKKKGDWLYGKVEVRAKLPQGRGTWPAIWMLPTDWKYGGWPESGEIDIMEHVGYDQNVVHATAHSELYNHVKQTQKESTVTISGVHNDFHIYTLDWSEHKMDFLVDHKIFHTIARDPKDDHKGWPFDQPFHLLMNIAVGGNWGGQKGVDETIWPQRMEVDYVRVYQ